MVHCKLHLMLVDKDMKETYFILSFSHLLLSQQKFAEENKKKIFVVLCNSCIPTCNRILGGIPNDWEYGSFFKNTIP